MWDLETIIRMNNEAFRAAKEKNPIKACLEASIKRNAGLWDTTIRVPGETTYLRSVYEGEVDGCSPQSGTGETLP
jgi:hypothetical protein